MNRTLHTLVRSAALASLFACGAAVLTPFGVTSARAHQTEAPRKPKGPAAGPIIRLPRGEGAATEQQTQPVGARFNVEPIRWEYCAITGFVWNQRGFGLSSPRLPSALIRYFPNTVAEVEGANEEDALANALAKLGDEGWELVAVRESFKIRDGDGSSSPTFYFKRLKRLE